MASKPIAQNPDIRFLGRILGDVIRALGGEALYKKQLARADRPLVQLRVARPSWRERARRLVERGKDRLRPLVRRLRGRRAGSENEGGSGEMDKFATGP